MNLKVYQFKTKELSSNLFPMQSNQNDKNSEIQPNKTVRNASAKARSGHSHKENRKEIEKKWGKKTADKGWVAVPVTLLEYQNRLELKANHLCVLLHLLKRWWYEERLPFESVKNIGKPMGISQRQARNLLSELEQKQLPEIIARYEPDSYPGFITRHAQYTHEDGKTTRKANEYSFEGLVEALDFLVEQTKQYEEQQKVRKPTR